MLEQRLTFNICLLGSGPKLHASNGLSHLITTTIQWNTITVILESRKMRQYYHFRNGHLLNCNDWHTSILHNMNLDLLVYVFKILILKFKFEFYLVCKGSFWDMQLYLFPETLLAAITGHHYFDFPTFLSTSFLGLLSFSLLLFSPESWKYGLLYFLKLNIHCIVYSQIYSPDKPDS